MGRGRGSRLTPLTAERSSSDGHRLAPVGPGPRLPVARPRQAEVHFRFVGLYRFTKANKMWNMARPNILPEVNFRLLGSTNLQPN